ncbi:MAG: hypothetical protein HZA08_07975 [Nitrospirae bacterium]|nr:hypothetical protein [Nitrospirota bacterium]
MNSDELWFTKGHENQWDKNVPPIHIISLDRRGFLTPPEGFSIEDKGSWMFRCKVS